MRMPLIELDALWLAVQPIDMRAGADRLLASVVRVFGAAQAHHGYVFANARATRIKVLVHDGFGVWCAARRLNAGSFVWPRHIETADVECEDGVHQQMRWTPWKESSEHQGANTVLI